VKIGSEVILLASTAIAQRIPKTEGCECIVEKSRRVKIVMISRDRWMVLGTVWEMLIVDWWVCSSWREPIHFWCHEGPCHGGKVAVHGEKF